MDQQLVEMLVTVGGALLALLLTALTYGAKKAADKIKNDYASGLMLRMGDAVQHAVLAVKQEYVDQLKDQNGDGKIDRAEAAYAKDLAMQKAKAYLGKKGLKELAKVLGAESLVGDLLGSEVEAQLGALKEKK